VKKSEANAGEFHRKTASLLIQRDNGENGTEEIEKSKIDWTAFRNMHLALIVQRT
jgi:hypothetical protein